MVLMFKRQLATLRRARVRRCRAARGLKSAPTSSKRWCLETFTWQDSWRTSKAAELMGSCGLDGGRDERDSVVAWTVAVTASRRAETSSDGFETGVAQNPLGAI